MYVCTYVCVFLCGVEKVSVGWFIATSAAGDRQRCVWAMADALPVRIIVYADKGFKRNLIQTQVKDEGRRTKADAKPSIKCYGKLSH